jgi:uncharacterized protein YchJ
MSTASSAQIDANIRNAQSSTGPRTEEGKATCSKNAVTHGLHTAGDFIRPGEENSYHEIRNSLMQELIPHGILEHTLVDEIHRATWRLRRCGQVEADLVAMLHGANPACILDPMETDHPHAEKVQKSVDRARAQAHRLLHKCTAELRKLQAERRSAALAAKYEHSEISRIYKTDPLATGSRHVNIARSALCPCQSGLKYKRCCGIDAPPVLCAA